MNTLEGERILCAAIWYKDQMTQHTNKVRNVPCGVVMCGHRHLQIIGQCSSLLGKRQSEMGKYVQGFLTNKNRFVDREEAAKIFLANGGKLEYSKTELFSEDLY